MEFWAVSFMIALKSYQCFLPFHKHSEKSRNFGGCSSICDYLGMMVVGVVVVGCHMIFLYFLCIALVWMSMRFIDEAIFLSCVLMFFCAILMMYRVPTLCYSFTYWWVLSIHVRILAGSS